MSTRLAAAATPSIDILVIAPRQEDERWLRSVMEGSRSRSFEVTTISRSDFEKSAPGPGAFDCLLMTLARDDEDPAGLVSAIARGEGALPLVVIGDQEEEPFAFEVLEAGASSYFARSEVVPRLLATSVALTVQKHRALSHLARVQERALHLSTHDHVTQLGNGLLFRDSLAQAISLSRRGRRQLAVLFLDISGLRGINETLGHAAGDRLLFEAACRIQETVRVSDVVVRSGPQPGGAAVSRLGGGEFTILLTEISEPRVAARVAQRVLDGFARPFVIDGGEVHVRASVGIAVFPLDGDDPDVLIRNAHAAMNRAKRCSPNAVRFFAKLMNEEAARKLELERCLHNALEREELSVHYQPVRHAQSGRLVAAEALARWTSPEIGVVSPAEFIPMAEESGLIGKLGEWVLRTACAQGEAWRGAGLQSIRLAVNVSVHQLRGTSMAETVQRSLAETGLGAPQLELEITESALVGEDESAIEMLRRIHDMGVGLALDDFGTGYSGLAHLRQLPIDRLKLDGTFTAGVATDRDDAELAAALINMAHTLRLGVVAECVETVEQASLLRAHGCDELQGYLFSPAVCAEDFGRMLEDEKATH